MTNKKQTKIGSAQWMVGVAAMTAIVVVLQLVGKYIRFGTFSISVVLIPIVIGAVLYGAAAGAWLGFSFGMAVLLSGDAAPFFAISPIGTIVTVLLKGVLAGLAAGLVYSLICKKNEVVATIVAAVVCPIVNTGVFLIGCRLFFMEAVKEWAAQSGANVMIYMLTAFIGLNFIIELGVNIILSPVILRIISVGKKSLKRL